jgi:predicted histidine transporter YuiF (NhaC family)
MARINMVLVLVCCSLLTGYAAGFSPQITFSHFNGGLGPGAVIALNYAMLGAFAAAVAHSGTVEWLLQRVLSSVDNRNRPGFVRRIRFTILGLFFVVSLLCKNFIPVHIAFIPILVPPLLSIMGKVHLDRRAVACVIGFGLVVSYMIIPIGFGHLFQNVIILDNLRLNGFQSDSSTIFCSMMIPLVGMLIGLAIAVFWTYARPKAYDPEPVRRLASVNREPVPIRRRNLLFTLLALLVTLGVQIVSRDMVLGNTIGLFVLIGGKVIPWKKAEDIIVQGFKMMSNIGMIMVAAAGFAAVLRSSGGIESFTHSMLGLLQGSRSMGALLILVVGLLITLGIGSSFATVPIVASLFIPVCASLGFSPFATVSLIVTSSILGDPGCPISNTTLGPTSGLGVDGQFNHMRDSVLPTFIHYNFPLLAVGWIAAMVF